MPDVCQDTTCPRYGTDLTDGICRTPTIVYIATTNDASGNPRRGWIIGYGTPVPLFCDEGYEGRQALKAYGIDPALGDLPRITVTPGHYRDWARIG